MNALTITGLEKTYDKGMRALKGIDLAVPEGDFFALLGPNGAGKSTAIGIICSLVNKTAGSVKVFDHDIDQHKEAAKASIGLVPQEFNFNVFEPVLPTILNVAGYNGIQRSEALDRAEYYLKKLDLWDKRKSAARELSGGMKRRLMIARALVHKPRLLILDEPTAGVDLEIRRSMWEFLTELPFTVRRRDAERIEVDVPKGETVNSMFQKLSDLDIQVTSLRNKSNRLEEFFIRLVGNKDAATSNKDATTSNKGAATT